MVIEKKIRAKGFLSGALCVVTMLSFVSLCRGDENAESGEELQFVYARKVGVEKAKENLQKIIRKLSELNSEFEREHENIEKEIKRGRVLWNNLFQQWESDQKCQDEYFELAEAVFKEFFAKNRGDVCGVDLEEFCRKKYGDFTVRKLYNVKPEGDAAEIIDKGWGLFQDKVEEEQKLFVAGFERYNLDTNITITVHNFKDKDGQARQISGKLQKVNNDSLVISSIRVPFIDLDEETLARVDDKTYRSFIGKKKANIRKVLGDSGYNEKTTGKMLLDAGFFPDLTLKVHFAIHDLMFRDVLIPDNWISAKALIQKISQKEYFELLREYYYRNDLLLSTWNGQFVALKKSEANEALKNKFDLKERLTKIVPWQKNDILVEEKRLILVNNLKNRGIQGVHDDIYGLLKAWFADMCKGKPTGKYWLTSSGYITTLFNPTMGEMLYEPDDFAPLRDRYFVPLNINSTTERGTPIKVTWKVGVVTEDGLNWKIISVDEMKDSIRQ